VRLTSAQVDRACGVIIGSAAGDALGAGYEFAHVEPDLVPAMIGGGLGDFAPGEWTDDTSQAVAIAEVAATGTDLRSSEALAAIARRFADWYAGGPADVGIQTAQVLGLAGRTPTGTALGTAAQQVHDRTGRSAGNGSLMRTGPVALAYLDDPDALVEAAMAISALTHVQDLAQEACAVWCLMTRHAVLHGAFPAYADIEAWVPHVDRWREVLEEAASRPPTAFTRNGWSVGALQAAWSAIVHTPEPEDGPGCAHLVDALGTAIRIGHDTDTVAAIAGALLGARWGISAVPAAWRRLLHGWPGIRAVELERLAVLTVQGGRPGTRGWPLVDRIDHGPLHDGHRALVAHPFDEGVYLAGAAALDELPGDVDAVVSLCRTGRTQVPSHVEHLSFRILDESDPDENPNLDFVLLDAARAVAALRAEGRTVLVHCVAAHSRTPAVGTAYAMLRGVPLANALSAVCGALPEACPNPGFRKALLRLDERGIGV